MLDEFKTSYIIVRRYIKDAPMKLQQIFNSLMDLISNDTILSQISSCDAARIFMGVNCEK
jgi:mannitol/fructose-specific phosphotransferase system IIA component (Ntr-type)